MEMDITKQRRNLMGLSLALIAFHMGDVKLTPISFFGGIKLENMQTILSLIYLALLYTLWRYWLYAKQEHCLIKELATKKFEDSTYYQESYAPRVNAIYDEFETAFDEAVGEKQPNVIDKVSRKGCKYILSIKVDDPKGTYNIKPQSHEISFLKYKYHNFKALLLVIVSEKAFSDLFVPYILSIAAMATWFIK